MKDKKSGNNKKVFLLAFILVSIMVGSYAWLRISVTGKTENVIRAGYLDLILDDEISDGILLKNTIPMVDEKGLQTKAYTFELRNRGTVASDYSIYLSDLPLDVAEVKMPDRFVKYSLTKNGQEVATDLLSTIRKDSDRLLDSGTISKRQTNRYTLKVWMDKDADNSAMGSIFYGKIRVSASQIKNSEANTPEKENISAAYTYNQVAESSNYCVTGEEATCVATTCYTNKTVGSCLPGTIIKYAVNDKNSYYFYVLHDDGESMTLQQRENTVYNTAWNDENNNTLGPSKILQKLEDTTSNWSNVTTQTYTMGTTNFNGTNAFTSCRFSNDVYTACTENKYTLESRSAKARMITFQESFVVGCTGSSSSGTCPIWMNNYLKQSTQNGGTVDDIHTENGATNNNGYYTMQAYTDSQNRAIILDQGGYLTDVAVSRNFYGARAVIVVTK